MNGTSSRALVAPSSSACTDIEKMKKFANIRNVANLRLVVGNGRIMGMPQREEVLKLVQTTHVGRLCEETPLMN